MPDQYGRLEEAALLGQEAAGRGIDIRMTIINLGVFIKGTKGPFAQDKMVSWQDLRQAHVNPMILAIQSITSDLDQK